MYDILGLKETVCGSIAFSACWCLIWKGSRQAHSDTDLICDMHYWQHSWRLNVLSYLLKTMIGYWLGSVCDQEPETQEEKHSVFRSSSPIKP